MQVAMMQTAHKHAFDDIYGVRQKAGSEILPRRAVRRVKRHAFSIWPIKALEQSRIDSHGTSEHSEIPERRVVENATPADDAWRTGLGCGAVRQRSIRLVPGVLAPGSFYAGGR
jgi:hypothetical protein